MEGGLIFYTDGRQIYQQTVFSDDSSILLYSANHSVVDMDYDWKTKDLFWTEDGNLNYMNIDQKDHSYTSKQFPDTNISKLAVDPHSRLVFWISEPKHDEKHVLHVWDRASDVSTQITTILLKFPIDLEYDRLNDRVIWSDRSGFIGAIDTNGSHETKLYTYTRFTGTSRHAITVFKKFVIATTAENSQIDVFYERDGSITEMDIGDTTQFPILDVHVFDSTLQPSDLEPCENGNGGCQHICLPSDTLQCACNLGYTLDDNGVSCSSSIHTRGEFLFVLDNLYKNIYQVSLDNQQISSVEIDQSNDPSSFSFDAVRNDMIWTDQTNKVVKKKKIEQTSETATGISIMEESHVAVDVTGGNIYVASASEILLFDPNDKVKTILDAADIEGTLGKIAVIAKYGLMVWIEKGSSVRIVQTNMDGSNIKEILNDMDEPEDIALDHENGNHFYWCDSKLDKIERVSTTSLRRDIIYEKSGLFPVTLDVAGQHVFFIPKNQRKILRMNKDAGNGVVVVMESPLFGVLTNLFISKPLPEVHELCGTCNGDCSTICLPRGPSRTCACEDDFLLKLDGLSCQNAGVCEKVGTAEGFVELLGCCPNLPNTICTPKCTSDYTANSGIQCKNGKWNVSISDICTLVNDQSVIMYYAGGGAAAAVVVVIIVIVIVYRRRQNRKMPSTLPDVDQINNIRMPVVTTNSRTHEDQDFGAPAMAEPPLTDAERVYDKIDYNDLCVDLPPLGAKQAMETDEQQMSSGSKRSDRYSAFPAYGNYGYITPLHGGIPPTDYPVDENTDLNNRGNRELARHGLDNDNDGYLITPTGSRSGASCSTNCFSPSDSVTRISQSPSESRGRHSRSQDDRDYRDDYHTQRPHENIPMAHLGGWHGSSSGNPSGSNSDGYATRISRY